MFEFVQIKNRIQNSIAYLSSLNMENNFQVIHKHLKFVSIFDKTIQQGNSSLFNRLYGDFWVPTCT